MELAAALPRAIAEAEKRYQYIERVLANAEIDVDAVSLSYAQDILIRQADAGQTIILMLDQSHINDLNEVLMVSVGFHKRAVPVAWRVKETQGGIGFQTQKDVLDAVAGMIPAGAKVMLAADRFYGTSALIKWCQAAGWAYRIRLKGNLTLTHAGGEMTTGEAVHLTPKGLIGAELCGNGVHTNIGIIHEKGHSEPWIIAMNATPSEGTTLDYGLRWGIEALFSDFKSRGFGLMQSKIQKPERLERLILIMAIAMHWALSCGMTQAQETEKKNRKSRKRGSKN